MIATQPSDSQSNALNCSDIVGDCSLKLISHLESLEGDPWTRSPSPYLCYLYTAVCILFIGVLYCLAEGFTLMFALCPFMDVDE